MASDAEVPEIKTNLSPLYMYVDECTKSSKQTHITNKCGKRKKQKHARTTTDTTEHSTCSKKRQVCVDPSNKKKHVLVDPRSKKKQVLVDPSFFFPSASYSSDREDDEYYIDSEDFGVGNTQHTSVNGNQRIHHTGNVIHISQILVLS